MTREAFIKILKNKGYSYEIKGDKLVVTGGGLYGSVELQSLQTLPPGVEFNNRGNVNLESLETLPPGVVFMNNGNVFLNFLKTLSTSVEFNNRGYVVLESLTSISPDVVFKNGGEVELDSLFGGRFDEWEGNIDGIDSKRLLNLMIKRGLFI